MRDCRPLWHQLAQRFAVLPQAGLIIDEVLAHHEPGDLGDLDRKHAVLVAGTKSTHPAFRAGITENYSSKKSRHGLLVQVASNDQRSVAQRFETFRGTPV